MNIVKNVSLVTIPLLAALYGSSIYSIDIFKAAMEGDIDSIRTIIDMDKTIVNKQDNYADSPLLCAIRHRQIAAAQELIARGADVNHQNYFALTPLHWAVSGNQITIIRSLLSAGADITIQNYQNKTPLQSAKPEHQQEIATLFAEHEAQKRIGSILALATHERLNADSPMGLIPQELLHSISQLAALAEIHDV